jgi:hypothetical protein
MSVRDAQKGLPILSRWVGSRELIRPASEDNVPAVLLDANHRFRLGKEPAGQ